MAQGETYEEFVEKFKIKKTTDDCYTPAEVMNVINNYVVNKYNLDINTFIIPFKPAGDYESEEYEGKVVVDNPPFSIMSKILDYYTKNNIKFFLFCDAKTITRYINRCNVAIIFINNEIIYENGARVSTAFITNLEEACVRSDVALNEDIKKALNTPPVKPKKIRNPRLIYGADLRKLAKVDYKIEAKDLKFLGGNFGRLLVSKEALAIVEDIKRRHKEKIEDKEYIKEELNKKEQIEVDRGF